MLNIGKACIFEMCSYTILHTRLQLMWIESVLGHSFLASNLLWPCSLIETSDTELSGIHWSRRVSYLKCRVIHWSGEKQRRDTTCVRKHPRETGPFAPPIIPSLFFCRFRRLYYDLPRFPSYQNLFEIFSAKLVRPTGETTNQVRASRRT